jgi:hypothetical protein
VFVDTDLPNFVPPYRRAGTVSVVQVYHAHGLALMEVVVALNAV